LDFAAADFVQAGSAKIDWVKTGSAEAHSAAPGPDPGKMVPATPARPPTTDFAIADSGNPPQDWRHSKRRTLSSVRTSAQRVKPCAGSLSLSMFSAATMEERRISNFIYLLTQVGPSFSCSCMAAPSKTHRKSRRFFTPSRGSEVDGKVQGHPC
jgi:hypothetical protein